MPILTWDRVGDRKYESGLDKGVLYLPATGRGVPWNGLTQVVEKENGKTESIYFDGRKINEVVTVGNFSASMKAMTYPDEFNEVLGNTHLRRGVLVDSQGAKTFGLCYRTFVGSDNDGGDEQYLIHILYNLIASPNDRTYATLSDQPSLVEFAWDLVAVPEEVPGIRPTAHITIDTRDIDPWLLEEIQSVLYGNEYGEASLIPLPDLITYLRDWYRVKITDNGDGTWTATENINHQVFIQLLSDTEFEIIRVNATYVDDDTYVISDTADDVDEAIISVRDNGDGTWTASSSTPGVIDIDDPDQTFVIEGIDVVLSGPEMYRITSTNT